MYLLDTNTCIEYLRNVNTVLIQRVQAQPPTQIRLCSVVIGELYHGAYKSPPQYRAANLALVDRFVQTFSSIPFDDQAAKMYGSVRADLEAKGTPIGPYDLQIAAIALVHQHSLVTHNSSEFSRVVGLSLEDWQTP